MFTNYGDALPSYKDNLARPEALESALGLTQMPYYRGVFEKAGALLRSMVKNHPYVDGNKRMGLAATFLFLVLNGRLLGATNEELVEFATELAATQMKRGTVVRWLRERSLTIAEAAEAAQEVNPGAGRTFFKVAYITAFRSHMGRWPVASELPPYARPDPDP